MAFIPVPGAARAAVVMQLDNQLVQCEVDVTVETEDAFNLNGAAFALYEAWVDHILPQLSGDVSMFSAVAQGMSAADAPVGVYVPSTLDVGGVSADSLPNNVAYCISKYTGLRGRSQRGRFFLPGIPSNAREGASRVSSAYQTSIVTACSGFLGQMIAATFVPVVISLYTAGAPRTTGIYNPITTLAPVDNVLDSQRRRLPGRGQ